ELWNASSLQMLETLRGPQGAVAVQAVAFSPDGQRLAAADGWGVVRVWVVAGDAERRLGLWTQHKFLALSRDGRLLATNTADPMEIALWDTLSGRELVRIKGKDLSKVNYAKFSLDSRKIFFGRQRHLN